MLFIQKNFQDKKKMTQADPIFCLRQRRFIMEIVGVGKEHGL